jgi:hypothetical protein
MTAIVIRWLSITLLERYGSGLRKSYFYPAKSRASFNSMIRQV